MKDLLVKKLLYVGIYLALAVFLEVMTFISMGNGIGPKYFMLDLSIMLMLATIVFVVPSFTVEAVLIIAFLMVQFILSFLNYTLHAMNGSVFTLDMMGLANEAAGAFNSEFMNWGYFFLLIAVPVVAVVALLALKKYRVPYKGAHNLLFLLVFCLTFMGLGSSGLYHLTVNALYDPADQTDPYYLLSSDAYLYDTFVLKDKAFKQFGTFAFYYVSVDKILEKRLDLPSYGAGSDKLVPAEQLTDLNEYFKNQEMSEQNPYSGLLQGQNLICIMIESGEWYGIDENLTPTLYALTTQGFSNGEYYARDKTNHSEAISILGSYPVETPFTSNYTSNDTLLGNNLAFTLPSVLKKDGYTTSYFHSNWGSYYGRETTHPVYGFTNFYGLEDLTSLSSHTQTNKDFYDFELDSDLFGKNLNLIAPTTGEPFFSFVTTLVTHGHYNELLENGDYTADLSPEEKEERSNSYAIKGLEPYYEQITYEYFLEKFGAELAKKENLSEKTLNTVYLRYKRYQAAYMDFDRGMAKLIAHLEENGMLDNTAIMMFGDHNAYYSGQHYYLKGIEKDDYADVKSYNVVYSIYSGKSPLTVPATAQYEAFSHAGDSSFALSSYYKTDRFSSSFSIVPTMLDLLGYTYNKGLYMDGTMFGGQSEITFISRESGMLNNQYFSSDGIKILNVEEEDLVEADVKAFRDGVVKYLNKQIYFEKMYLYDFFAHADEYEYADISKLVYLRNS